MLQSLKNLTFEAVSRAGRCDIRHTIVVNGSPRSGTTWVLELLRRLPDYKALNEPLMYEKARQEYGFSWRTYLEPGEAAPEKDRYLRKVLTGRVGIAPAWHFEADNRAGQLWEQATRRKLVVKFCRLSRMLHWFVNQFDVRGLIFIVRHPCAVVSSMLRHGGWEEERLDGMSAREFVEPDEGLPSSLRETFEPVLERIETRTEALATLWGLDHYVPLVHQGKGTYPWMVVPYERLVAGGQEELLRMSSGLELKTTAGMEQQFDEPSSSVKNRLHRDAEKQLSKWRRHLSTRQVEDILRITEETGLSKFYTHDLEPDYNALNDVQRSEYRW